MILGSGQVIALHRVSDDRCEPGPYRNMAISPTKLESWLAARPEGSLVSWQQVLAGSGPEGWSLITLDDGYRDNLEVALPLLERYNAPAIVFATVSFIAGEMEPFSASVARMMRPLSKFRVDGREYDLSQEDEFEQAWRQAYRGMDRGSLRLRTRRLENMAQENGCVLPRHRSDVYMSWDELRDLARHPLIQIGAHSWTHPRMSRVTPWVLWNELYGARRRLERELDGPVTMLAYPHGAHNMAVRRMARVAGYRFAFTTAGRPVEAGAKLNPLAIPRISL